MTRERAISDLAAWFYKSESDDWEKMKTKAARIIDVWVSDGSLKLDEPPLSPRERFKLAMKAEGYNEACVGFCDALRAFDKAQ